VPHLSSPIVPLELAVECMDLTSLSEEDTDEEVRAMCATAVRPDPGDSSLPSVAAVCTLPRFVPTAVRALEGFDVKVAAVAGGFPTGSIPVGEKVREIREVVHMGAYEVDVVLNRAAFLDGGVREAAEEVEACKEASGDACLKVILETGALGSYDVIRKASIVAMEAGADFIKTSTGRITPGATFPAVVCIMEAIRDFHEETGRRVGIKVAGGIRTSSEARGYMALVRETLGSEWLSPERFRIGASTLLNDLLTAIRRDRAATESSGAGSSLEGRHA
jgi:deoxyribose-phosphate aldolase